MSEAEIASSTAAPADENRDDVIKHLKEQLAAKTEGEARANARMAVYESKERARISAWQPEAKDFMCDFINQEIEEHHPQLKDDVAVFTGASGWAHTYHEKPDIAAQGALAAVSYVASKGIKRLREQASQGAQAATTLAETMKQNEELAAQNAKLQKDCNDYKVLSDERQKGLEALQAELTRAGLFSEQFNFSKLASRERRRPLRPSRTRRPLRRPRWRSSRPRRPRRRAPPRPTRSSRRTCSSRCSAAAMLACV